MPNNGPTTLEVAQLMSKLAEAYTIGGLTDAAGIAGGRDLQLLVSDYLAELAQRHSFVDLAITAGFPAESALAAAAWKFVSAARTYLSNASRSVLGWAAANPNKVIAAGAIAGALGVTHSWLTIEERTTQHQIEQLSEMQRLAFNSLSPEQRAAAFAQLTGALSPKVEVSNWIWIAGAAALGIWIFRAWQSRE